MATANTLLSKDQILRLFKDLQREQKAAEALVKTKAQEAQQVTDKETVKQALNYTVESVVKGLADLQLKFQDELDGIAETLEGESSKLLELRRAIGVERAHAEALENIRIAAEAMALLTQSHEQKDAEFEERAQRLRAQFTEDKTEQQKSWEEEQANFEETAKEYEARLAKDRQIAEEEYNYDLKRKHELEADTHKHRAMIQTRALEESSATREKNWAEREEELAKQADELAELRQKDAAFPEELKAAEKKAYEAAMKKASKEASVKANLAAKEFEANNKVYLTQIESLTKTLETQNAQIITIREQLQVAAQESQDLAVKAIASSTRSSL